jgi:Na+:H+ antiporter, NhaA family
MAGKSPDPGEPSNDRPRPSQRIIGTFVEFDKLEASGSIVLVGCAAIALVLANSPLAEVFLGFWERHLSVGVGEATLSLSFRHWINDGLMALFFFLVGLEIKRELIIGELSTWRRAVLPILAAVGGMAVPAAIYFAFNSSGPSQSGWAVPMATDIAFSLGVLALLGSRVPLGVKVFLTALAIADDLGAVLVIALFYTPQFDLTALLWGLGVLLAVYILARKVTDSSWLFTLAGPVVWVFVHESGIHATLAGVMLALTVPSRRLTPGAALRVLELSKIESTIHHLHPWITYLVVPLFALANAGVTLAGATVGGPIAWGVALGLAVGKPVGVFGFSLLAVKAGFATLPRNVNWIHILAAGVLAGIGFTMSLFIAELAFGAGEQLDTAKIGIFAASILSAFLGYSLVRYSDRGRGAPQTEAMESASGA